MGRTVFSLFVLGLFAACGGQSVYTEGGTGGEGGSGGSTGGSGGKGGRGGKGGGGSGVGGIGGATGGTGGDTGGSGGAGGAVGGAGGRTGGTGGVGGALGGAGGRTGGTGGTGGVGGGPAGAGGTGIVCPTGYANCGNTCVDPTSHRLHCGACGNVCPPGELCENGRCELSCQQGLTECAGICVDTDTDRRFCGSCEQSCGAGEICEDGECVITCRPPLVDCGGVCTSIDFDPQHCGECGNPCPQLPSTEAACIAGECIWECDAGTDDCNGSPMDGCEADLEDDEANCGACGNECAGDLGCVNGACPAGTWHWELVTDHACNAWCSKAPAPFNTCAGPWECGPGTSGGLIWIYAGGPTPPPNPASSETSGYGWVHWYCDRNGCDGPGEPSGSCDTAFANSIYRCVFD